MQTICPIIIFAYVSSVLEPVGIGKINFSNTFVAYFIVIADLGIKRYGIRECAKYKDNKNEFSKIVVELFIINILMTLLSVSIILIVINISNFLVAYKAIILIYCVGIPLSALSMEWVYQAMEEYVYITRRIILFRIIGMVCTFLFVKSSTDILIFAIIQVVTNYGNYILNFVHLKKYVTLKNIKQINLAKHILPIVLLFAASVSENIYGHIDITMLAMMLGDKEVGFYSVAIKIVELLRGITMAMSYVLLPRITYMIADGQGRLDSIYSKVCHYTYMIAIPCICGVIIWGDFIISLLGGNNFAKSYVPLVILSITILTVALKKIYENTIFLPNNQERTVVLITLIGIILNIIVNAMLIPKLHSCGAGIASVISEIVVLILYAILDKKNRYRLRVLRKSFYYVFGGMIILFCWYICTAILRNPLEICFLSTVAGGIMYFVWLIITKNVYLYDFFTAIKNIRIRMRG